MANNLPGGSHQVVLSNLGSGNNGYTDFDYAIATVYEGFDNGSSPSGGKNGGGSHKTDIGAIVGGVVAGVLGFALLAGLVFFLLRRRRKQEVGKPRPVDLDSEDPDTSHPGSANAEVTPFVLPPQTRPEEDMPPPTYERVFPDGEPKPADASGHAPDQAQAPAAAPAPQSMREKGRPAQSSGVLSWGGQTAVSTTTPLQSDTGTSYTVPSEATATSSARKSNRG
jgi:hypothetical protein